MGKKIAAAAAGVALAAGLAFGTLSIVGDGPTTVHHSPHVSAMLYDGPHK